MRLCVQRGGKKEERKKEGEVGAQLSAHSKQLMKFNWGERVELRQSVYREYCCISEGNQGVIYQTLKLPEIHIYVYMYIKK